VKKIFMSAALFCIASASFAQSSQALNFINSIQSAADGDEVLSESVFIECPAKSGSGQLLVTKASYDYGKSKGAFIFKNTDDSPAIMTHLSAVLHDDDLNSDKVDGFEFGFKIHGGQFFVTVLNDGIAKVGVNANGKSGVDEVTCKVVDPG
jgi:opacity protein-like surface antigen